MKTKLTSNQLPHIDNNFYRLTARQARHLCVGGVLPAPGNERRANLELLASFEFGKIERYETASNPEGTRFRKFGNPVESLAAGWVLRTPLSWFDGEAVESGWVWAVHIR